MFSGDAVVSVVLFLLALSILSVVWSESNGRIREYELKSELVANAESVADSLLYTRGSPDAWRNGSVSSIGFSDGVAVNPAKFLRLNSMDYDEVRGWLGLGDYDFRVSLTNSSGSVASSSSLAEPIAYFGAGDAKFLADLNASGLQWDFYDSVGAGSGFSQKNYFSGTQLVLVALLSSSVLNYSTIVFEDADVSLNSTVLNGFLDAGGTIVFEGGSTSSSNPASVFFNLVKYPSVSGVVSNLDFLVFNASVGDAVSFASPEWVVSGNGITSVVSMANDSTKSLAGYAKISNGLVFFVSDYSMSSLNKQPRQFFNLAGSPLTYGIVPASAEDVFIVKRPSLIGVGRKKLAVFELVVSRS